jgi:processive 1,2-diacylglycerol beta-glucosyltransferase
MSPKKILLLSVSAGSGHTRAAEAIRCCAGASDHGVSVIHLDVMDYVTSAMRKLYIDFYLLLVKQAPALCGFLYQMTNKAQPDSLAQGLRRWAQRLNSGALLSKIAQVKPDLIICTHFLPAEILSQRIAAGRLQCPVWVQVTDFDLHRMWVHPHMAGYFAANEEVAFRMRDQGIAAAAIHVTGIPVMPAFSQAYERAACARECGLDPARMTILLMGGGDGLGSLHAMAQRLLTLDADFQLVVLAGKNAAALAGLWQLAGRYPGRLWPQGFTDRVERLMACADLVITKPGGLTTSECLAMGLPMIANAPLPGQEEHNADFLLEQGVALKAFDGATLAYRIGYLLAHPEKLADMRAKAGALGRPDAAGRVLAVVLSQSTGKIDDRP